MGSGMTWSVRGIEDEARERALEAARRSGMTVGEWLNSVIMDRREGSDRGHDGGGKRSLERRLEELSERLERLGTAPETPPKRPALRPQEDPGRRAADLIETLEGLDRRLKALSAETGPRPTSPRPAASKVDAAPIAASSDSLRDAIAEINARRAALAAERERDEAFGKPASAEPFRPEPTRPDPMRALSAAPLVPPRADPTVRLDPAALEPILDEIRDLRRSVESRRDEAPTREDLVVIQDLAARVDALARQAQDRSDIEPLIREVSGLREGLAQAGMPGTLKSLEHGYGHIVERLDELRRRTPDRTAFDRVSDGLTEVRERMKTLPGDVQIEALHRALDTLTQRVERLADRPREPETRELAAGIAEIRRVMAGFSPAELVRFLDQRLGAVTDKIEGLERHARGSVDPTRMAALLEEVRDIAAGNRTAETLAALQDRTEEIARRLAAIETAPAPDSTGDIALRIADLAERLDRFGDFAADRDQIDAMRADIAALMHRLDQGLSNGVGAQFGAVEALLRRVETQLAEQSTSSRLDLMEAFEGRISRLVDKLERLETRPAPASDSLAVAKEIASLKSEVARSLATRNDEAIEARLGELSRKIDQGARGDERVMLLVEDQLARLVRQVEAAESRFAGVGALEEMLGRIEGLLAERPDENPSEAARVAAREAVAEFASFVRDEGTAAAVEALRAEMRELQAGLRDHETTATETLRSVHDALLAVSQRLGSVDARPPTSVLSELQASIRPASPKPEATRSVFEDSRPLEPGSGKPSPRMARMPEPPAGSDARGTGYGSTRGPAEPPRPEAPLREETPPAAAKKADFIAAARRAAMVAQQAKTLPVDEPVFKPEADLRPLDEAGPETDLDRRTGPLARIGAALRGRRRPLTLAAAAVLLAVFALQLIPTRTGEGPELTGTATAPTRLAETRPSPEGSDAGKTPPVLTAPSLQTPSLTAPAQGDPATLTPPSTPAGGFASPHGSGAEPGGFAKPPAVAAPPPQSVRIAAAPPGVPGGPTADTGTAGTGSPSSSVGSVDPTTTGGIQKAGEVGQPVAGSLPEKIGSPALRKAALAGDAKAQFEIGMRFAEGKGITADPAEAAGWYARAAAQGFAPAQYRLGSAYEKGHTGNRDVAEAKRWYLAAAEKGNVRAMHNLGVLHANDRDMANAIPWFERAAASGLRDSQFNLGIIHALGSGVKQDLAVSYKWFALAAAQGDKDAEKKRDDVAAHLDKTALAAAKMAAQTFRPKPVDRIANDETAVWVEPAGSPVAGTAGERVQRVQALLQSRGIYSGPINGDLNDKTRQAIRTLQRKLNMKPTGEPDEALLKALETSNT